MLAKVLSGANVGLNALPITVEVDIANQGLPSFTIVGLADRAIEEAKERVRAALRNSGIDFPPKKITVNLAPADLPKEGPLFDLPIAIGILIASGQIEPLVEDIMFVGELSLDGTLRHTQGILPITILAKKLKIKKIFIPTDNQIEASVIEDVEIYPVNNLKELSQHFLKVLEITPSPKIKVNLSDDVFYENDFSQIKGQEQAKRALEIAAAGGHNLLLKGPPGAGKTLLARSFPSILPPLSLDEALEITQIYSVAGKLSKDKPLITTRPFRSPHHTASYVGIIGGGNQIHPGEISMANRGVLFLDELPEFPRQVLEALRQPLEDREVVISRATGSHCYPAKFILIAAQNPCPCGYLGSSKKTCTCLPGQVSRYSKKLSGPLLDRIDIHLDVPAVDMEKLTSDYVSESSASIRERVIQARKIQSVRFKDLKIITNSEMTNPQIKQFCKLSDDALDLLKKAISQMNLSARSYHRILKLSRTIADLSNSENITLDHVAESLQYRAKEEN